MLTASPCNPRALLLLLRYLPRSSAYRCAAPVPPERPEREPRVRGVAPALAGAGCDLASCRCVLF